MFLLCDSAHQRVRCRDALLATTRVQVVLRAPAVLELSVQETLLPRVAFLRDTVGVAAENLGKVILRLPSVLTYSEESMQQRIDFLLEAGLSREDLAKAVTSHTQVPRAVVRCRPRRLAPRRLQIMTWCQ